jgi:hypothetical protein
VVGRARIERQREIEASIAAKAESEYLYDKPYEDRRRVSVAGPFTVDSLSPLRTLAFAIDDGLIDGVRAPKAEYETKADFASVMLENLKAAGVQQAHEADRISFSAFVEPHSAEMKAVADARNDPMHHARSAGYAHAAKLGDDSAAVPVRRHTAQGGALAAPVRVQP